MLQGKGNENIFQSARKSAALLYISTVLNAVSFFSNFPSSRNLKYESADATESILLPALPSYQICLVNNISG
jgi:hypothetical protein